MPLDEATAMRIEILDALIIAVDNRRRLFDIIAAAPSADEARRDLMGEFDLNGGKRRRYSTSKPGASRKSERARLVQERDDILSR